jgi:hypothetical protein
MPLSPLRGRLCLWPSAPGAHAPGYYCFAPSGLESSQLGLLVAAGPDGAHGIELSAGRQLRRGNSPDGTCPAPNGQQPRTGNSPERTCSTPNGQQPRTDLFNPERATAPNGPVQPRTGNSPERTCSTPNGQQPRRDLFNPERATAPKGRVQPRRGVRVVARGVSPGFSIRQSGVAPKGRKHL